MIDCKCDVICFDADFDAEMICFDAEMIRYRLHPAVDRNTNHWSRIAKVSNV